MNEERLFVLGVIPARGRSRRITDKDMRSPAFYLTER
jgi:CMP-N-acetylneuraminic acid synthetase